MSELNAIIGVRKSSFFIDFWGLEEHIFYSIRLYEYQWTKIKGQKVIHFVGLETFFLDILATANNDSIITAVNIKVDN